jgi:hypothetical protein
MSATVIIVLAILLPLSAIFRFLLLDRWIGYLNQGLPPDQQFQLIGWWTPFEHRRARRRWRELRRGKKNTYLQNSPQPSADLTVRFTGGEKAFLRVICFPLLQRKRTHELLAP